jgi:hypothetical protein
MVPRLIALAVAGLAAGPLWAESCLMGQATPIPELEAINAALVAGDYAQFTTLAKASGGIDAAPLATSLQGAFPDGFDGCVTVLQRKDIGGMVQSVVYFHGGETALNVYWLSATEGGAFSLLSVNMNSDDLDKSLAKLR